MMKCSADEAGWYDSLVIMAIKASRGSIESGVQCNQLDDEIDGNLGRDLHSKILESEEYRRLWTANAMVFALIDEMRTRNPEMPARVIDAANHDRFLCKKALQSRFFPNSKLTEVKIGYDSPQKSLDTSSKSDTLTS